ncbi:MAG: serine/threonine protein kinase [Phormidium sp. BM_Day4_Bin.17]|nr:serine/threonine protein kinase [Phormidium sp. BM_Day4_Bin.17]UCJ11883.1 MAG: serine/threonine protein kinase [Phormidium sp. PBR-2020]
MTIPLLLKERYRIIRHLGSGGFGDTFLAEDIQIPSVRYCVVKCLKPVAENLQIYTQIQERFQREAAILEDLGDYHSQIPTLYAYFRDNNLFYLVQEYIEGETLFEHVKKQGKLSESITKKIINSLLDVLEYVHSKNIIHRDIKPDNIILRQETLEPVLIDFGAVKEVMGTVLDNSGNITSSVIVGTPGFMPSEQAIGRPIYSSDVYALGLTAIYALTGKFPHEFANDPLMGTILWRNHVPGVTSTFANVIDRAIHPHASHRFPIVRQMRDALTANHRWEKQGSPSELSEAKTPRQVNSTTASNSQYDQANSTSVTPKMAEWQKAVLTGGVMGLFLIASLVLSQPGDRRDFDRNNTLKDLNEPMKSSSESESETPESPTRNIPSQPSPEPTSIATPQTTPQPPNPRQVRTLGWVRIGAVDIEMSHQTSGASLIRTSQPVTISPPFMPKIGDEVIISNNVNLRVDHPKPPNYRLAEQSSVLPTGQRVIIQDLVRAC